MPTPPHHEPDARLSDAPPAYILAGGRSVRFGSDKARARVEDQPLISQVAQAVSSVSRSVTVVAQASDEYADLGLTTIADAAANNGPIQGLLAALIHRLEQSPGWLLLAACDMLADDRSPFVVLIEALPNAPRGCRAVAFRTDRWHPMPGLYHTAMLPSVAAFLADGRRAFQDLLNHPTIAAYAPHMHTDPLAKLVHANTPDQLRAGLQRRGDKPPAAPAD